MKKFSTNAGNIIMKFLVKWMRHKYHASSSYFCILQQFHEFFHDDTCINLLTKWKTQIEKVDKKCQVPMNLVVSLLFNQQSLAVLKNSYLSLIYHSDFWFSFVKFYVPYCIAINLLVRTLCSVKFLFALAQPLNCGTFPILILNDDNIIGKH